jgi:membrane-associated phospholipid phosphatase
MHWIRSRLRPEEALLLVYGLTLLVLMAVLRDWSLHTLYHPYFIISFLVLAVLVLWRGYRQALRQNATPGDALRSSVPAALGVFRDFLPFLLALVFYERLHDLTPRLRPQVVDASLIAVDRAVFGVDVPVWLDRFATPVVTQAMVVCYLSYFFAAAILACLIYWAGRRVLFREFLVSLTIATTIGYLGYLLVPAVGPYLFQKDLFSDRLPGGGLPLTEQVIASVDALKGAARDCFPSLHTTHTTVVLVFAWRFRRTVFWAYLPMALGLYVSTMYLRMHYAVDVAAGFATATAGVLLGPLLERSWRPAAPAREARVVTSSAWR